MICSRPQGATFFNESPIRSKLAPASSPLFEVALVKALEPSDELYHPRTALGSDLLQIMVRRYVEQLFQIGHHSTLTKNAAVHNTACRGCHPKYPPQARLERVLRPVRA